MDHSNRNPALVTLPNLVPNDGRIPPQLEQLAWWQGQLLGGQESEVDELRQMICQFLEANSRRQSQGSSASQSRTQPQSPPSPPHPSFVATVHQATPPATAGSNTQQQLLSQNAPGGFRMVQNVSQTPTVESGSGISAQQFGSGGNLANCNPHLLQLFLATNGLLPQSAISSATAATPQPPTTTAIRMLEQLQHPSLLEASAYSNRQQQIQNPHLTTNNNNNLVASTLQMLQETSALHQNSSQQNSTGARSNNNDFKFYEPVAGIDASETSSSASSTNTQIISQHQPQQSQNQNFGHLNAMIAAHHQQQQQQQQLHNSQLSSTNALVECQKQPSVHQCPGSNASQNAATVRAQIEAAAAAISRSNGLAAAVASHLLSTPHAQQPTATSQQAAAAATLQQLINDAAVRAANAPQQPAQQHHTNAGTANQQLLIQQLQQQLRQQQHQQQQHLAQQQKLRAVHQHHSNHHTHNQMLMNSVVRAPLQNHVPHRRNNNDDPQQTGQAQRSRVANNDDYVKVLRSQAITEDDIRRINIPVREAIEADPAFRALPEQQVVQLVLQNKKYENASVAEVMAQLCKKLAEKRVFGSKLMSTNTVAAPNHSTYTNLPNQGILYIQYVCKKVLMPRIGSEEAFWDYFKDSMRKLAARCRRVRHAKKQRSPKYSLTHQEASDFHLQQQQQLQSPHLHNNHQRVVTDPCQLRPHNNYDAAAKAAFEAALAAQRQRTSQSTTTPNNYSQIQADIKQVIQLHQAAGNNEMLAAGSSMASVPGGQMLMDNVEEDGQMLMEVDGGSGMLADNEADNDSSPLSSSTTPQQQSPPSPASAASDVKIEQTMD